MKVYHQSSHGYTVDRSDERYDTYTLSFTFFNLELTLTLLVNNALQYGGKWCHSNTSSNQNSMLSLEDVCGRSAIRTINENLTVTRVEDIKSM